MSKATLLPPECSCIKMGSDENHFNVSLVTVRDNAMKRESIKPLLLRRKVSRSRIEPRSFGLPALTPYR